MRKSFQTYLRSKRPLLKNKEQPFFIEKLSTLLKEGYSLSDSLNMLIPHHLNQIEDIENSIHAQLIEGKGLCDILNYLGIKEQYLMSLYVAEQSGTVNNALLMVAKKMKNTTQNRAQLVKLTSYPIFLFIFLIVIFVSFRSYFLPNMETMVYAQTKNSTIQLTISNLLLHLPDFLFALVGVMTVIILVFLHYVKSKKTGEQLLIYYKIPLLNRLLKLQLTRLIAYELGTLLESGFSLQSSLKLLSKQNHQKLVAYNATLLLTEISQGESLAAAVLSNPYFHGEFYTFVDHGERSGNLGKELQILSEFMVNRIGTRLEKALNIVQPVLFFIIAICILGAYISIMLPMYDMINYV